MDEKYLLFSWPPFLTYEFFSEGPKGRVTKRVDFQNFPELGVHNLSFGDVDSVTNELNDRIITDNRDSKKVMAAIITAVMIFCERYPQAPIYLKGNTEARNRLYRMTIARHLQKFESRVHILGQASNDEWIFFRRELDYKAFLIQKKLIT
jgi:hypothetical protein